MPDHERIEQGSVVVDTSALSDSQFESLLDSIAEWKPSDVVGTTNGRTRLIPLSNLRVAEELAPSPFVKPQELMQ